MYSDNLKLQVTSSADIEIAEDKYWVVVTIQTAITDCLKEQLPPPLQERLYRAQRQVDIIRILARNLVYAKMYKDFISVGLLKWQATQNQENYEL